MASQMLLNETSEQYRELFEDAPVAYHELDARGIIRRVNRAECALLGYSAGEMIGQPIWNFIAGEESTASQEALARKLAGTQPLAPFLRQYLTRSGRRVTVEIHDRLILDAAGVAVGIRSALIDVTDRVAAQKALHESERWLGAILASLHEGVLAIDALGRVKFMNGAFERISGWKASDAAGRDVDEIFAFCETGGSPEAGLTGFGRLLSASFGEPWRRSVTLAGPAGEQHRLELTSAPIVVEDGRVAGVVLTFFEPLTPGSPEDPAQR